MLEERVTQPVNNTASLTIKEDDIIYKQYNHSTVVGIQLLLGNLKLVFSYLKSQLGIVSSYDILKPTMRELYMCPYSQAQVIPVIPPSEFLLRKTVGDRMIPQNGISIKLLEDMLHLACQDVTDRNWDNALKTFKNIIRTSLFFIATDNQEETRVKEIISICTEYIYLLRLTTKSEEVKSDKVKFAELTCLMTVCKLSSSLHRFLINKKAKAACKTIKNYITGVYFLKKMLAYEKELSNEFGDDNPFGAAHNEFDVFQKVGTNQHNLAFNTNENLPHIRTFFCSRTFTKIDKNSIECPLDGSVCQPEFKGQICETCNLTTLGEQVLGLKLTI
jgi:coatomer protein complex subunit alpha (xenin)